jgi:hypothetical protein
MSDPRVTQQQPESRTVQVAAALDIGDATIAELRESLPAMADEVLAAITLEVPSYTGALSGRMGTNIRRAVRTALGNFLDLVGGTSSPAPDTPLGASSEAAYDLGRGEARNGRSMDALLAAYRVGARVSWRGLSATAVSSGLPAGLLAKFAELVFSYIDELSAASAAGHADELATTGRARERYLEQLGHELLRGATEDQLLQHADRADWKPPQTLTAVLLPTAQMHPARRLLDPRTLLLTAEAADLTEPTAVLLVPDADGASRAHLLQLLTDFRAIVGPTRPWTQADASFARAVRANQLTTHPDDAGPIDTEQHLVELVLSADQEGYADLRARALAPLDDLRPAAATRLQDTLRAWLLHQGRRDDIAAHLYVHPQTVRYRMSQLRELFGDRLNQPHHILELTLALATPPNRP